MNRVKVILLQLPPTARGMAIAAAQLAFPVVDCTEAFSLREANEAPQAEGTQELLVIASEDSLIVEANQVRSHGGQPRWAIIALGDGSASTVEIVPPQEWSVPLFARTFRYALDRHKLQREILNLRGDLRTVARRVSHDLRSPISCIHTNADLLIELSSLDLETIRNTATVVQQSVTETLQTLDRVGFALLTSVDDLKVESIKMAEIVEDVIRVLEQKINESGATFEQPSSWPEVMGAPASLRVIWTNLIENCLIHAGSAPKIELNWIETSEGFRFTVTDNGPGVAAARIPHLFAHFDQLHAVRGRGLGLSITQRLVALHGGQCGHQNLPGGGAMFYFNLPSVSLPYHR